VLAKLYKVVLLTFSASTRQRWGADMVQLLQDQLDDARSRGESQIRVFLLAVWDALVNGVAERLRRGAAGLMPSERRNSRSSITDSGEGVMEWVTALRQDVAYGVRQMGRRPMFAFATVLVLALGIGANTAVFSVVEGVLLRAVPLPNADRLVRVSPVIPNTGIAGATLPGFQDWDREKGPFEALGAYHTTVQSLMIGGMPERLLVGKTVGDLFGTAGLTAAIGRTYTPTEPGAASQPSLLLTDAFWRTAFGSDPGVVGQLVDLDGQSVRVLGVLPAEEEFLRFGRDIDAWAPMDAPLPWMGRGTGFLTVLGRLRADLPVDAAEEPLLAMANGLIASGVTENGITMVPLRDGLVGDARSLLWALQGSALLLMLVVAINAANLLLARSLDRTGEFAVRSALGASRGRITRQVLVETTLLALLGGIAGLGLALLGRGAVLMIIPDLAELAGPATLSLAVLGYTFATALGIGILAGLWPAMRAASRSWSSVKTGIGRRAAGGAQRGRRAMAALEIGLALILVVSAGLMVRTVTGLAQQDLGLDPTNVLTARITLPGARYEEWPERHRFWQELVERANSIPGVESAGLTGELPLNRTPDGGPFQIEGREWPLGEGPSIDKKSAGPGYFEAMGIPVLEGRTFTPQDRLGSPLVTVVSATMARRFFPNEPVLGKKIRLGWWGNEMVEIVGVVGDVKQRGPDQESETAAYLPQAQIGAPEATLVVRATGEPYALTNAIRNAVLELDPGQPIYSVTSMDDLMVDALARRTALTTLLLGLSVIALLISCLGVYAVTAQAVQGRTKEIGIRMALGATGGEVLRSVILTESLWIVLGVLFGAVATTFATRALESLLFGVTGMDPFTLLVSVSILGSVAMIAVLIPARRAAGVDPAGALGAGD
jgi:putative ABC transport system permease protein